MVLEGPEPLSQSQRACRVHAKRSNIPMPMFEKEFVNVQVFLYFFVAILWNTFSLFFFFPVGLQVCQTKCLASGFPGMSVQTSASRHKHTYLMLCHYQQFSPIDLLFSRSLSQCETKWTPWIKIDYFVQRRMWMFFFSATLWLLAVTFCLLQKKKASTQHMGVKLLGQDKCIANHFELVPPAEQR